MKYVYPAIFTIDKEGIIVTFPDLDDTFTDGDTMEEAFENAEDVLTQPHSSLRQQFFGIARRRRPRRYHIPLSKSL